MKKQTNFARVATPLVFCAAASLLAAGVEAKELPNKPTVADVVKASTPDDWRPLDPENTLYLELASGRVVIELAPYFAPEHVANVKALVREGYFDGLPIMRVQDNYVVQWGDPDNKRTFNTANKDIAVELTREYDKNLKFDRLPDGDGYAPQVGFSASFPAARNPKTHQAWLAHCYGMLGAGRDNAANSGIGTELYVVIGQSPRHLDRNVVLFGRVMSGIELLSTLRRGTGPLGFYEIPKQYTSINAVRLAADVPAAERSELEILRSDTPTYTRLIEAARNRGGEWFKEQAGYVNLCNVPIVVRQKQPTQD
jgi:cyclophilin family peptidyl-prolyl cis-trans isomerase